MTTLADYDKAMADFCVRFAAAIKIEAEDFKVESIGGYYTPHTRYVSEPVSHTVKIEMPLDMFCEISNIIAKDRDEAIVRDKVASVKTAYEHYQFLLLLAQQDEKK